MADHVIILDEGQEAVLAYQVEQYNLNTARLPQDGSPPPSITADALLLQNVLQSLAGAEYQIVQVIVPLESMLQGMSPEQQAPFLSKLESPAMRAYLAARLHQPA